MIKKEKLNHEKTINPLQKSPRFEDYDRVLPTESKAIMKQKDSDLKSNSSMDDTDYGNFGLKFSRKVRKCKSKD